MKLVLAAGSLLGVVLTIAACTEETIVKRAPASEANAAAPAEELPDASDAALSPPARPKAPAVTSAGGPVLKAPKLLLATFGDEPLAPALETFAKTIGATPYWKDVTSEYGVGPAQLARVVNVTDVPATITQIGIEKWLAGQLDGTHPEWGAPDASTIYTLVFTKQTQILVDGVACAGGPPAWHGEIKPTGGTFRVPYAVITRCEPYLDLAGIDFVTSGLSHEWVEASTNPFYSTDPAFSGTAKEDAAWSAIFVGEVGDMCASTRGAYHKPEGFPFMVQRSWSNASAAAGHDPCVPRPAEPYFNAAPVMTELVAAGGIVASDAVHGIVIPVGGSRTVDVALFGDGETDAPFEVHATDYAKLMASKPDLAFEWDKTKGKNGDVLHLTITRVKADGALGGAALFMLTSKLNGRESFWVGAVGDAAK
jgi:hypothetical protein